MTTIQMLSLLIMPVGALVIAGLGLLWIRTWDDERPKPGEHPHPGE
ncbi:hypothetical protein [Kumtagia ephedrae]|jgi:hypothetical protein|nr:hypothetical protein [Mesorhizobium ephedrae]